ncbi:MAG TPA: HAMP domain-containing sensor histidine kinase [Chloroflexia bacterium]|nr:HAMP domain-containing sensor histidine kinase [Chloroflexia bacterium]
MSLRWRLTLLSTLSMALVFAAFSALAVLTVRYFLYQTIDDNLDRQSHQSLDYILRHPGVNPGIDNQNQVDAVFYTVMNADGSIRSSDRQIQVSDAMFTRAISGETVKSTQTLPDGTRIRILMQPISSLLTREIVGVLIAATPLVIADNVQYNLTLVLVIGSVLLLCFSALGSYLLTGRTLRAVEKVTQKAHQIEISQDLSQRIPDPGKDDEVGHLVRTFNQMLARIESTFESQRRFVADSSHELRTPLTVIRSNLHLLSREADPSERAALISVTEGEVSRLNRMVNDLLYIAQMQAGHDIKPVLRPVELDSILLDVFARARSLTAIKNQKVTLLHEDVATTFGDRDQLQHLLLNLVDNAIKYTPEGGTIGLGLWIEGGTARIEVTDTGPGIPQEELPHIFDRFFRTQSARDTVRSGSGLGLSIVKTIAEAHGGRIEVNSRLGEGTTFCLYLNVTAPTIAADPDDSEPEEPLPTRPVGVERDA